MATKIERKNWASNFTLIGHPVLNDFSFKIDEHSNKSNWIYNSLNLGIDAGEKSGVVYASLMGGYSENGETKIYAHGKDDDGNDDFKKAIVIDFEDRFNESIIEEVGKMSFIDVGLERTDKGKLFVKHFLSAYDAIAYVKEHITEDMILNVKGNLQYSTYNDVVQVNKNITSIMLSNVKDSSGFKATFVQSILIDKDSASFKNIDKDKGVMYIDTRVLDYVKEINGVEVRGQYPFHKQFEYKMDFSDEARCKKIMDKLFKVKKGIDQVTMEGEFVESGAVVQATMDDLSDDIKELIELGIYTKEEALAKCAGNGNKLRSMVLTKPYLQNEGDEDRKVVTVQRFENRYEEEDLILDCMMQKEEEDVSTDVDTDEVDASDPNFDWLNALS